MKSKAEDCQENTRAGTHGHRMLCHIYRGALHTLDLDGIDELHARIPAPFRPHVYLGILVIRIYRTSTLDQVLFIYLYPIRY